MLRGSASYTLTKKKYADKIFWTSKFEFFFIFFSQPTSAEPLREETIQINRNNDCSEKNLWRKIENSYGKDWKILGKKIENSSKKDLRKSSMKDWKFLENKIEQNLKKKSRKFVNKKIFQQNVSF